MQRVLKQKKCKSCGGLFSPISSLAKVCSMACSLDFVGKERQRKESKENAIRKKDFLESDKSFQKAKAQKAFNEYIRLRDSSDGCISCDKHATWHGQWHAGHYKTVGARADLRFNEDNCHKQCSPCNNYLSGNLANYVRKLTEKIGVDRVMALDITPVPIKYTAEYYRDIFVIYKAKIKELKACQTNG